MLSSPIFYSILILILLVALVGIVLFWKPVREARRKKENQKAIELFKIKREHLEAKFFDLASCKGKPRGLKWVDCDWHADVTFASDRETGLFTAFVSVTLSFEAIEGGDMEDVEAVHDLKEASAIFHCQHGLWGTGGRALFNMTPTDAIERLHHQYQPVNASSENI